MTWLRTIARRFGYDVTPLKKAKSSNAQLIAVLKHQGIDTILDVGANVGQYGKRLRDGGYGGRIVSFEPLAGAHRQLSALSASDPRWTVAPSMAIGDRDGYVDIQVSAETDMSSILPQSELLQSISPTSEVRSSERVPIRRLDSVAPDYVTAGDRILLKVDTQGFEPEVLEGAETLLPRLVGVQLEMSLLPIYEGERDYLTMIRRLDAGGFGLHLVLPGYFERKLGRMLEIDGVFVRKEVI